MRRRLPDRARLRSRRPRWRPPGRSRSPRSPRGGGRRRPGSPPAANHHRHNRSSTPGARRRNGAAAWSAHRREIRRPPKRSRHGAGSRGTRRCCHSSCWQCHGACWCRCSTATARPPSGSATGWRISTHWSRCHPSRAAGTACARRRAAMRCRRGWSATARPSSPGSRRASDSRRPASSGTRLPPTRRALRCWYSNPASGVAGGPPAAPVARASESRDPPDPPPARCGSTTTSSGPGR